MTGRALRGMLLGAGLLLGAEARAEGGADALWVELPDAAARARARASGMGWAEGQRGDWYLLDGTPEMAEAAGLRWRREARATSGWSPSSDAVAARLRALPGATLVQLGESRLGVPILAARLGDGGRALRVLGGHHGDEPSSVEIALRVAEAVAQDASLLPAETELWVVPVVNPDGLDAHTRENAAGVDLNRNYGWEWDADVFGAGPEPFSEPETRAIRALARARSFDAGLSLHAGAQNIGWVWNWTTETRPVEEALLASLAEDYAAACAAPGFWTTNGADWYVTHGDTTDWSYGAWGTYDYTLEVTEDKSPPEEAVETYVAWHLDAILAWLARPPDLEVQVRDAATGDPIPAALEGPDARTLRAGPDGRLARWIDAGDTSEWTLSAPGYAAAPFDADASLVATGILDLLPVPRLLSRGAGPVTVRLAGVGAEPLTLSQPGEEDVVLAPSGDGAWEVDPDALAPGAWTLTVEEGVIPRGLFVGEADDRVRLDAVAVAKGILTLGGDGFAEGAEAWSIGGAARALHPLPRLTATDDTLVFSLSETDDDVLVWVNGAWLAAADVHGDATIDTQPPPQDDTARDGPTAASETALDAPGVCAAAAPLPASTGIFLALLLARRRRAWRASGAATADRAACGLP